MMNQTDLSLMQRLKAETAAHHARAEGKALQRALIRGQVTREQYGDWLGQMWLVHRGLEEAIFAGAAREPALRVVTEPHGGELHRHSVRLADDLAALRTEREPTPIAATARLLDFIAEAGHSDPIALLGMHYVLEGSMNGNKFIAVPVRKALGLTPGRGDRYLDPYGDRQREVWAGFRAAADELNVGEGEKDRAVAGAQAMFDAIGEISDGLDSCHRPDVPPTPALRGR